MRLVIKVVIVIGSVASAILLTFLLPLLFEMPVILMVMGILAVLFFPMLYVARRDPALGRALPIPILIGVAALFEGLSTLMDFTLELRAIAILLLFLVLTVYVLFLIQEPSQGF